MIEKAVIPFLGIQKNVDERELTVQAAELKNCLINSKGHIQIRPGTNNLTIPSLDAGEEVIKNYRWNGAEKNILLTNHGRVFEYYQITGQQYGIIELVDLETYIGNELYENDPSITSGYNLVGLVKTTLGNYFACGASQPQGSGNDMQAVFMAETDGTIVFTKYDYIGGSGTDGEIIHCAPVHIDFNNVSPSDNVRISAVLYIGAVRYSSIYEFNPLTGAVSGIVGSATTWTDRWLFPSADHKFSTFTVEYRPGLIPKFGYQDMSAWGLQDIIDIPNTIADQEILAGISIIDPGGTDLKVFLGMDDNNIEAVTITGTYLTAYVYTWSQITTLTNTNDYITHMSYDAATTKLIIGTNLGKLYEAIISTTAQWNNPSFSLIANLGVAITGVNHKVVDSINYWYLGLPDGMYVYKNLGSEELVYNPEASETDYKKGVSDYISITHSGGQEGYLFFNSNNTDGKVYAIYPGAAKTVEGFTYLTECNVEIFETDKSKIDPTDVNEIEQPFLIILFVGRLVYYKMNGGEGKIRYYWDPIGGAYTSDEIPLIRSAGYTDGLIVIAYEDKNRFTWSRPTEILHFDDTVYASANYSPTPNIKIGVAMGLVFIFSVQDTEIWSYTPNTVHDKLMSRVGVIQSGLFARNSVFKFPGYLGWLDQNRSWVFSNGGEPQPLPNSIMREIFRISTATECISQYVRIENLEFLFFTFLTEDKTFVYDMYNDFFYEWDEFKVASAAFDIEGGSTFAVIDNDLTLMSQDITSDDGSDINLVIRTPWIDHGCDEHKICRWLDLTFVKEISDTEYIQVRKRTKISGAWSDWRNVRLNTLGQHKMKIYRFGRYQKIQFEFRYSGTMGLKIIEISESYERLTR